MAVFSTERTARKRHRCTRCGKPIEPGRRYEAYAITPNSDLGNGRYWVRGHQHATVSDCYPETATATTTEAIR